MGTFFRYLLPSLAVAAVIYRGAAAGNVAHPFYHYSIPTLWILWLLYWSVAAIGAKTTRRRESLGSLVSHLVPLGLGFALLTARHVPYVWLSERFLPRTVGWFWVGFCLVALGLGFSVLARVWLGGNWSGTVTLKQNHELIRSGPYRWVRHPIYTGLLVAVLGSAIALGEWRGLLALVLITVSFSYKLRIEERFLTEQFGAAYTSYQNEVPRLMPLSRWR
jgi:protein-S-isoprenylcysteine O-methyltransferase Ste14